MKDQPAATCPNTDPGCAGEFIGGACWFLGEPGESCTCADLGENCDPATVNFAGTGGTFAGCDSVVQAILLDSVPFDATC